jgi:hypothetical protein
MVAVPTLADMFVPDRATVTIESETVEDPAYLFLCCCDVLIITANQDNLVDAGSDVSRAPSRFLVIVLAFVLCLRVSTGAGRCSVGVSSAVHGFFVRGTRHVRIVSCSSVAKVIDVSWPRSAKQTHHRDCCFDCPGSAGVRVRPLVVV